jgi:SAM-dependent methyltransferase
VLLTPDAGAPISRVLGARWPEVQRPGEHIVLYSRPGLTAALSRHGFSASGWHTTGKAASVATLVDDASAALPGFLRGLGARLRSSRVGERVIDVDPRTKFVVYARRLPERASGPRHAPARIPKQPAVLAHVDEAIVEELESLSRARRYGAWLYDTFGAHVAGARVLEVGAGIGTFSERMLADGAKELVLIEPEARCADRLDARFGGDARVAVHRDLLPDAACLAGEDAAFDLVVCQNVLEHIGDDGGAVAAMARALRPGGHLALIVPAGPGLYGPLDEAYGHWRRYDEDTLRAVVAGAGLEVVELRPMNGLGIPGWWLKNRRAGARVGAGSLRAYDLLAAAWRPFEERRTPRHGLSLVCVARRP